MMCEKCWGDAYLRSRMNGKPQSENYYQLLDERKDNPCLPEQQIGEDFNATLVDVTVEGFGVEI